MQVCLCSKQIRFVFFYSTKRKFKLSFCSHHKQSTVNRYDTGGRKVSTPTFLHFHTYAKPPLFVCNHCLIKFQVILQIALEWNILKHTPEERRENRVQRHRLLEKHYINRSDIYQHNFNVSHLLFSLTFV